MVKGPIGGRPSKAALLRMKAATAVVSVVAFAGSLGAVAYLHPGVASQANAVSQVQTSGQAQSFNRFGRQPQSSGQYVAPGVPSQGQFSIAPRVRTARS